MKAGGRNGILAAETLEEVKRLGKNSANLWRAEVILVKHSSVNQLFDIMRRVAAR